MNAKEILNDVDNDGYFDAYGQKHDELRELFNDVPDEIGKQIESAAWDCEGAGQNSELDFAMMEFCEWADEQLQMVW